MNPKDIMRQQAEAKVKQLPSEKDPHLPQATRDLFHELRVHQIELEMQNDELRRSQTELEAVRSRYFDLYNLAPVGYFTVSDKGLIIEANLTATTLLIAPKGDLVTRPFSRFVFKADHPQYYLFQRKVMATLKPQMCGDIRIVRKDGTPFWAQLQGSLTTDDTGASVLHLIMLDNSRRKQVDDKLHQSLEEADQARRAMLGVFEDQRQTATKLLESEKLHRAIIRTTTDGFWLADIQGRLLEVNEAYCRMSGYSEQELLGMHISDLEVKELPTDIVADMQKILVQGASRFESRHRRKDGSLFAVEVVFQYHLDVGGRFSAFLRDITAGKQSKV